jgi:4-hydroxythreonine-4-phosphate dehydrogenase
MKVLIVADDLTGAAESASAFSGWGETWVIPAPGSAPPGDITPAILAIDAGSRSGTSSQAAARTARLFARHAAPDTLMFKKLDSTLRGYVGAEIAAALGALSPLRPLAVVAPAFPAMGRTTRGGRQYVRGVPVEDLEIWRQDAVEGTGDIAAMLTRAGLRVGDGTPDCDALVGDAETDADLAAIVARAKGLGRPILWAGSAGLAQRLADMPPCRPQVTPPQGRILFLIGSRASASHAQAAGADPAIARVTVTPGIAPRWPKGDAIALLDPQASGDPHRLAAAFAEAVAGESAQAGALFVTGGETAQAVLAALETPALRLLGEAEPGVIVSRAEGGRFHGRIVISKAGAFGGPDVIDNCRAFLRGVPLPRAGAA